MGVKIVDADGTELLLEADTVLVAAGMRGISAQLDSWHELAGRLYLSVTAVRRPRFRRQCAQDIAPA